MKLKSNKWVLVGALIFIGLVLWNKFVIPLPLTIPLALDTWDILSGKGEISKTYPDSELGFNFKHPSGWYITKSKYDAGFPDVIYGINLSSSNERPFFGVSINFSKSSKDFHYGVYPKSATITNINLKNGIKATRVSEPSGMQLAYEEVTFKSGGYYYKVSMLYEDARDRAITEASKKNPYGPSPENIEKSIKANENAVKVFDEVIASIE